MSTVYKNTEETLQKNTLRYMIKLYDLGDGINKGLTRKGITS